MMIPTYSALLRDVSRQKRFIRELLLPELRDAMKNNDGTLDDEDIKKITDYYGFGVPAIVGEGFCTLRGYPMNKSERIASTFQGALTGLYDDFFDKTHVDTNVIREMMENPAGFRPSTSLGKLFIRFLLKVHEHLPDRGTFGESFSSVFDAQMESRAQAGSDISRQDIREITFNKGGVSLLFYRSVFEHRLASGEADALYHAGALMQLGNDIFDAWEDSRAGINTLVTSCNNISEVKEVFSEQLGRTLALFGQTGYERRNISRFLHKFVLGISRCHVCLNQLERLERKTANSFIPSSYNREEMICDMEKPTNMFRSLKHYLQCKELSLR